MVLGQTRLGLVKQSFMEAPISLLRQERQSLRQRVGPYGIPGLIVVVALETP